MNIEWIDILGFENNYMVSNTGQVKNKNTERILKPTKGKDGYLRVDLRIGDKRKNATVHRVLMESFFGATDLDVNHKDGNKSNNNINNLEFCTRRENLIHALDNDLRKPRKKNIIIAFNEDKEEVMRFEGYEEVFTFLGVKRTTSIWRASKEGRKYKNMFWRIENTYA